MNFWEYSEGGNYLSHHGILGQHWGVKHGPPYPLNPHRIKRDFYEKLSNKHGDKGYSLQKKADHLDERGNHKKAEKILEKVWKHDVKASKYGHKAADLDYLVKEYDDKRGVKELQNSSSMNFANNSHKNVYNKLIKMNADVKLDDMGRIVDVSKPNASISDVMKIQKYMSELH